jgi:hypothetical protein
VIEDVTKPAACGTDPLALLKSEEAPAFFVRDWAELPAILARTAAMSNEQLHRQRCALELCADAGTSFGVNE